MPSGASGGWIDCTRDRTPNRDVDAIIDQPGSSRLIASRLKAPSPLELLVVHERINDRDHDTRRSGRRTRARARAPEIDDQEADRGRRRPSPRPRGGACRSRRGRWRASRARGRRCRSCAGPSPARCPSGRRTGRSRRQNPARCRTDGPLGRACQAGTEDHACMKREQPDHDDHDEQVRRSERVDLEVLGRERRQEAEAAAASTIMTRATGTASTPSAVAVDLALDVPVGRDRRRQARIKPAPRPRPRSDHQGDRDRPVDSGSWSRLLPVERPVRAEEVPHPRQHVLQHRRVERVDRSAAPRGGSGSARPP